MRAALSRGLMPITMPCGLGPPKYGFADVQRPLSKCTIFFVRENETPMIEKLTNQCTLGQSRLASNLGRSCSFTHELELWGAHRIGSHRWRGAHPCCSLPAPPSLVAAQGTRSDWAASQARWCSLWAAQSDPGQINTLDIFDPVENQWFMICPDSRAPLRTLVFGSHETDWVNCLYAQDDPCPWAIPLLW